ncbi:aromatic-ring-hydroxylating dioxygenase subunit beta [Rhodococcus sp. NPDC127530]|uniref:aromatic-ring-hydroxylating dioxygenase subunit beta n=1 Tax=unclassified Rhodococcus (in: high G+C Gram-positive bacteria) TaxID=192944 RepID=UPI00363B61F9
MLISTTVGVDPTVRARVDEFLAREAALLDERRITDWLELVTDDFTYKIPHTQTPDTASRSPWNEKFLIVDETKSSIASLWTLRYAPDMVEFAWGENPPQRTRRFLSSIRIEPRPDVPDIYDVHASVLLSFAREAEPVIFVPAGRHDVLHDQDGVLKLGSRVVFLDQRVLNTGHLRLVI